jgi:hypothetical protein
MSPPRVGKLGWGKSLLGGTLLCLVVGIRQDGWLPVLVLSNKVKSRVRPPFLHIIPEQWFEEIPS